MISVQNNMAKKFLILLSTFFDFQHWDIICMAYMRQD
jgi:hypothetical protein